MLKMGGHFQDSQYYLIMAEDIKEFTVRLMAGSLSDGKVIDEKLRRFEGLEDRRLCALLNHEFFSSENRLTAYLLQALQEEPKQSEPIRKRLYLFIGTYVRAQYLSLIDHVKSLFSQLVTLFWREEGRLKESSIDPLISIIQVYEEDFLTANDVLNPVRLHEDIKNMLQTHSKVSHGVIGECWYLLSVVQSKFPHAIGPANKKSVQEIMFVELKKYVSTDKNLGTIAALLRGLARALRENYFVEANIAQIFHYVMILIPPVKPTYAVHLAALELLSERRELFHYRIMAQANEVFSKLRDGVNHKNKEYKIKCLEVLVEISEQLVKGIAANKQRNRPIFTYMQKQILEDLKTYIEKDKGVLPDDRKGLSLLTVVRLLGIIAPLYVEFEGRQEYKQMFDYIIKKCTRKIMRENNLSTGPTSKGYDIKYVLYAQKELNAFVFSLSRLVEQLHEIEYSAAGQLEEIFIAAVRESKYFLAKYEADLWEALIQLLMSMHAKGAIFGKWAKKVVSESLKECLDSQKMGAHNDEDFIRMIEKAGHLWRSILTHASWRSAPLHEFTHLLLANLEYLLLNLNCSYRVRTEDDHEQSDPQEDGIVQIFYMANERIEIAKVEDYQFLGSLSLLFHEVLTCIDPSLYSQKLLHFYPLVLERIRAYPKCLPLLRTLRSLNEYALRTRLFKDHLRAQPEYARELLEKMGKFFKQTAEVVFKYQEQYFYELLKLLLSFPEEVYFADAHRIAKHHLPALLVKTFELGQEVVSLAHAALRCTARLFEADRQATERYLQPVIASLEKYINLASSSEREEFKSQLFLFELAVTRETISDAVLSFLGSLGGLCHQLVDSKTNDHISWDYDCRLEVEVNILNEKLGLNLTRFLNRVCWLSINGKDDIKIVACELLHAQVTYVIEEVVSNKMDKDNLATFLDRVLPTVLAVAGNPSHPSQQLLHSLLIQVIHFFANTKQPNSPDVQVILKHLLSLYNKSEDLGYIASKCLSEFIRWHIKQQPEKSGDVPVLKALMSNIWSLVGNRHAREGIVHFLLKLLKIIHREAEIMRYYSIELGSLLISLARDHHAIEPEFKYLLEKYTACLKKYIRYLIIPEEGRRYKKTPTIHEYLDDLYKTGFFSIFQQQREAAFLIWTRILKDNPEQLGYNEVNFLRNRANTEKKYLFGGSRAIDFQQVEEADFGKCCWRLIGLGEVWLRMLEEGLFAEDKLIQFLDLECIYLVSFVSLLNYIRTAHEGKTNSWPEDVQEAIVHNFKTFLAFFRAFSDPQAEIIYGKFNFNLDQNDFPDELFQKYLFGLVFHPDCLIKGMSRDILTGEDLKVYLGNFINYMRIRELRSSEPKSPLECAFWCLAGLGEVRFSVDKMVDYFCMDETASERVILAVMDLLRIAYNFEMQSGRKQENNYLKTMISKLLNQYGETKPEREYNIIQFLLGFNYSISQKFVCFEIETNSPVYQRYEKDFIQFVVDNWERVERQVIRNALSSVNHIKLLYVLILKLNADQKKGLADGLAGEPIKDTLLPDLLRINFLLAKELPDFSAVYAGYLERVVEQGLLVDRPLQVHEETLYLCGVMLQRQVRVGGDLLRTLKATLNTLGNKYCPFCISKLDGPEKQEAAIRYFSVIRNFIVLAEEFVFIDQFFVMLKDLDNVSEGRRETIQNYIEDCVRTCFTLESDRPLEWAEMLLRYYWDDQLDKDEWSNYRLLILERIFRKTVSYMRLEHLQMLYDRHIAKLDEVLQRPLSGDSLKSLLLDMQVKNGAFLLVELLYGNLPRREKREGMRPENENHKLFIKYATGVAKHVLNEGQMRLIREHDLQKEGRRAMRVYKDHNCYAYNCLIVLFISTQSNKEHFKTFLFEHNKHALWDNFVDVAQTDFPFEIETAFKVMQPYAPLRNKIHQIKTKIEKNYFQSSLYVVQEENVPMSRMADIAEEDEEEEEKEAVPIKNAHNIMLNTVVEEDVINRHPCMMNLLRVVDFLTATFPEHHPGWMQPIERYLDNPKITLAETILILKLVLNRPHIFHQADVWARPLLNYLAGAETGSKFIHYFYRDALKRFLKFLPELVSFRPEVAKVNQVIMRLVKNLPHDNVRVFSDNIDMLEELLRVPGVYVERKVINSMLRSEKEDKNSWKMCAVITLKLCLAARVPVLAEPDYLRLRDSPARFEYYHTHVKSVMSLIFELAAESSKQYRIAAAGFLGEWLSFIFTSDLEEVQKKEHFRSVSQFLVSLLDKAANRTNKEKFTLALEKISMRFPQLLADEKLFAIVEDGMFQFSGTERYQLLLAFREFIRSLLAFSETAKVTNFFMLLRVNCEKAVADTPEVQLALLQLLNLCTDHRLLKDKDILFTFHLTLDRLHSLSAASETIATEYYLLLVKLKKYLVDPESKHFDFCPSLLAKVEEKLVEGLSSGFETTRKMVFSEFQTEAAAIPEAENIHRYLSIFRKLYHSGSESEWLVSVVPLILTLCRVSSDYNRLFSQAKLEDNMCYYDWDFRNFRINDASLPYTPFTALARREQRAPNSQGANLRGLIRATQNNSLSQEEQIFTMLESLSSQESQPAAESQPAEEQESEQYHKINDLFRNRRRRNEVMDTFKENNISNSSPAVQFVEDKIRFVKNYKVEAGFKRLRGGREKEKGRRGVLLRAYKIGELPNIEISPQHLVEPLIFLAGRDHELASELFLQLMSRICALSIKNCDLVKDTLCGLLLGSTRLDFNFVATLQKCLIRICQKHGKFLDISLKAVARPSNTLHYAVLFTEENIIQLLLEGESTEVEAMRARKAKLDRQWYDLAEYYQLLNELDMIESVMYRVTEGKQRDTLIDALRAKNIGDVLDAQKLINQLLATGTHQRLTQFLEKEKIDCSVLLSEWDVVCAEGVPKLERGEELSGEQLRMLVIAAENLEPSKRASLLPLLEVSAEPYDYERGILSVMRDQQMDKARYHALNAREVFRREWERISSFAYNSKHELLQSLQKNYELTEFLQLYRRPEVRESDCRQLFTRWSLRKPDELFDDNITWVQILSSRTLLGRMLGEQWGVAGAAMARSNTEWLVQVVKGMVQRGVLGYAENTVRKALAQHKLAQEFNWNFYEAISQLKLMQVVRKNTLRLEEYQIVPKLIQKEMDTHSDDTDFSRFKLITIRNQYLEGFLQICLSRRREMDLGQFVRQTVNVFRNYEAVVKGLGRQQGAVEAQFHKATHFKFALFLESLLSVVKGKFEVKQAKERLEEAGVPTQKIAEQFIHELILSIKLADMGRSSYEQGQQLFSMLLKLLKLVQVERRLIGARFEEALANNSIPKWMFIYFIPQIIRNLSDYDLAAHFRELFDHLLHRHPEALVYPFNCAYPRRRDCVTELTRSLFDGLRGRVGRYFDFIESLFLIQHPEMRLKDILTKYLNHRETDNSIEELKEFIAKNPLLGKYNQRFHQNNKNKISALLELNNKGLTKELEVQMRTLMAGLDPNKSNMMKYFTKLSDGSHWFEDYNCSDWTRLEVPGTSYTQFEEPHSWNKVYIQSFDSALLTLASIRRPKRITLLGSNEKVYMLLVKGGEDVRLDQRVEHLFELVNRIMSHDTDTNRKQLEISTFEVVPMKPMFGVFEWVDKSKTLRAFYEAELKILKGKPEANLSTENEGFVEFYNYFKKLCPSSDDRHVWHKTLMARPEEEVVKNMNRCEARIPYGLLRFGLEKLAKNYDSFLHIKNRFIANYSAICLITYIFGIGDRHLENFLIQTSTGNLVMIDFGYSFCAGIELPIPELIPFRLTRSIRDLAAPLGIDGSFRKCMLACFQALNKKMHLIVDYCDVFVDDPLMEWVWVSRRQLGQPVPQQSAQSISSAPHSFSVSQETSEKKLFSNKIKVVENKLRGQNPRLILETLLTESRHKSAPYFDNLKKAIWGKSKYKSDILSGENLVNELITLATDRNVTGRSYIGLNLFV